MKTNLLSLAAIFAIALFSNNMNAQANNTSTETSNATATIIAPIVITVTNDGLEFGSIVRGSGNVTVAATSAGERTAASGATFLIPAGAGNGTAVNSAAFSVTGEGAYTFSINLPENGDITLANAASVTMAVNNFTSNGVAGTGDTTSALVNGAKTIYVGATLTVANLQASGSYAGTFPITVAYN